MRDVCATYLLDVVTSDLIVGAVLNFAPNVFRVGSIRHLPFRMSETISDVFELSEEFVRRCNLGCFRIFGRIGIFCGKLYPFEWKWLASFRLVAVPLVIIPPILLVDLS